MKKLMGLGGGGGGGGGITSTLDYNYGAPMLKLMMSLASKATK